MCILQQSLFRPSVLKRNLPSGKLLFRPPLPGREPERMAAPSSGNRRYTPPCQFRREERTPPPFRFRRAAGRQAFRPADGTKAPPGGGSRHTGEEARPSAPKERLRTGRPRGCCLRAAEPAAGRTAGAGQSHPHRSMSATGRHTRPSVPAKRDFRSRTPRPRDRCGRKAKERMDAWLVP